MRRTTGLVLVFVAGFAVGPGTATADGTIVTTDAELLPGGLPPCGNVMIEAGSPDLTPPTIPAIPAIEGLDTPDTAFLALPPIGSGASGAFSTKGHLNLPGGTYEYTSYSIEEGAVVTYSGAVTLRVTGSVSIDGAVQTLAGGAPITIVCDDFQLIGDDELNTDNRIVCEGAGGGISIHTSGKMDVGSEDRGTQVRLEAPGGDILLSVSTSAASGDFLTVWETLLGDGTGGVTVLGSQGTRIRGFDTRVRSGNGDDLVVAGAQGSGSVSVLCDGGVRLSAEGGGAAVVEAHSGDVKLDDDAIVSAEGDDVTLAAFDGSIDVLNQSQLRNTGGGAIFVDASDRIGFAADTLVQAEQGRIDVVAETGDLTLEEFGGGCARILSIDGAIELLAGGGLRLLGDSRVVSTNGSVTARAVGGDLEVSRNTGNGTALGAGGALEVTASGLVACDGVTEGSRIDVTAANSVTLSNEATALGGPFTVLAGGLINLDGSQITAQGDLTATSVGGNVQAFGAVLGTADRAGASSGNAVLETHRQQGTIDVTGSEVRTGDSDANVGSIALLVHTGGGKEEEEGPREAFVLPTSVRVRLDANRPARNSLLVLGTLDTGPDLELENSETIVQVGPLCWRGGLIPRGGGRQQVLDGVDAGVRFGVPGINSSRRPLRIQFRGEALADVPTDGPLTLRITQGEDFEAEGSVSLTDGRFKLALPAGALLDPDLAPKRVRARVVGDDRDSLRLQVHFRTDGLTPPAPPDVGLQFGDVLQLDIPGGQISGPVRDRFTARRPAAAPDLRSLILDYRRQLLTVRIKRTDLGAFAVGESAPVTLTVTLDGEENGVRVRLGRRRSTLAY